MLGKLYTWLKGKYIWGKFFTFVSILNETGCKTPPTEIQIS